MIKINSVPYSGNKIVLPSFFEGDVIELESTSNIVTWKLVQFPTTDEYNTATFDVSNTNPSTLNHEEFTLDLVGTYYIKAVERDVNGNYHETKIYIRSNSIITHATLPFSGEKDEVSDKGWGVTLLEHVLKLTNLVAPMIIVEIDGGSPIYTGEETEINGGNVVGAVGFELDGGDPFSFAEHGGGGAPQIQTDWNQDDDTEVDFIKNKPSILEFDDILEQMIPYFQYTFVLDEEGLPIVDEEGNYIVDIDYEEIRTIVFALATALDGGLEDQVLAKNSDDALDFKWKTIPEPLQSDWYETDTDSLAFIQNKPEEMLDRVISIPIEFPEDGDTPPSEAELIEEGNKKIRIRRFVNNNGITWDWTIPEDLDYFEPVQFRVRGITTMSHMDFPQAGIPIHFNMRGYVSRDMNEINDTFSEDYQESVLKSITDSNQHLFYITPWSNPFMFKTWMFNGDMAQISFKYIEDLVAPMTEIGVSEIQIKYKAKSSKPLSPYVKINSPSVGDEIIMDIPFSINISLYKTAYVKIAYSNDGINWTDIVDDFMETPPYINELIEDTPEFITIPSTEFAIGDVVYLKLYSPVEGVEDIITGVVDEFYVIGWHYVGMPGLIPAPE